MRRAFDFHVADNAATPHCGVYRFDPANPDGSEETYAVIYDVSPEGQRLAESLARTLTAADFLAVEETEAGDYTGPAWTRPRFSLARVIELIAKARQEAWREGAGLTAETDPVPLSTHEAETRLSLLCEPETEAS